jgi:TrmH family RNA methyltransferase
LVRTGPDALRAWIARHAAMAVGATPDAQHSFQRVRYREPTLLLLGNERRGLSPAQRALSNHRVRIPMRGPVDSLNLAVAGSMLLYEARRVP